jgi:hypothetical protein
MSTNIAGQFWTNRQRKSPFFQGAYALTWGGGNLIVCPIACFTEVIFYLSCPIPRNVLSETLNVTVTSKAEYYWLKLECSGSVAAIRQPLNRLLADRFSPP